MPVTSEKPEPPEPQRSASRAGAETILVAEDNPDVRGIAVAMLKARGYETMEASDGEEAAEIYRQHKGPIHLLLTDVIMRRMDGRRLADIAVRLLPNLRVLYMSGYTADILGRQGALETGLHLIEKPFSPEQLLSTVRELLDQV